MDNFQDSKIAYRLDEMGMSFTLQNKNNVTEAMLHFMLLMKQHLFNKEMVVNNVKQSHIFAAAYSFKSVNSIYKKK